MLLLFVMSALAIAVLLNITGAQDRRAREQSLFFAQRAIEGIRKGIGRDLSDYSKWSDAYRHLHASVDKEWAYDQENVGSSVFSLYGYQAVFVISPTGQTVYSVIDGQMSEVDADTWLAGDLRALLKKPAPRKITRKWWSRCSITRTPLRLSPRPPSPSARTAACPKSPARPA